MKIVETDNFDGDYPDEKFVNLPPMDEKTCQKICDLVNKATGPHSSRYWKVIKDNYKLAPPFEP